MLIEWSASADNDLEEILAHFTDLSESEKGRDMVARLIKSVDILATYPLAGRTGRIAGTRELIPPRLPYILIYHIAAPGLVEIVRVLHTSRLFPESLFPPSCPCG